MDKIEHADLAKLIKQQIMVPKTIYEAIQSLKNFYALATLLFTEKSHLCIMLFTWVDHILANHRIYEFQQQSDPNFIAAFLFKIDKAASIFLHSCHEETERTDVDDTILNMSSARRSIVEQNFFQVLPPGLSIAVTPQVDDIDGKAKRQKLGGIGGGPANREKTPPGDGDKGKRIENTNSTYAMAQGGNFSKLFYANRKTAPKSNGSIICLSYWVHYFCYQNCPRVHDKGFTAADKTALGRWIAECRAKAQTPEAEEPDFVPRAEEDEE